MSISKKILLPSSAWRKKFFFFDKIFNFESNFIRTCFLSALIMQLQKALKLLPRKIIRSILCDGNKTKFISRSLWSRKILPLWSLWHYKNTENKTRALETRRTLIISTEIFARHAKEFITPWKILFARATFIKKRNSLANSMKPSGEVVAVW